MATETAAQTETLATAKRHGTHWTQTEIDRLRAAFDAGKADRETAKELGRTLYAVRSARRLGDTERTDRGTVTATRRPVLAYDRGYTDIESLFA